MFAGKLHVKEVCVVNDAGEETCVDKWALDNMLAGASQSQNNGSGSGNNNQGNDDNGNENQNNTPTITILGNNPANVEIGATYSDLGATAQDSNANDLQ